MMPKISELTVADLRGARDQIQAHLMERCGIETPFKIEVGEKGIGTWLYHGRHDTPDYARIIESAEYDADWTVFMDRVWKRVGQIPSKEVREVRSVMEALGGAIEILKPSASDFAIELSARLKALRDEAGARLLTHQAAE